MKQDNVDLDTLNLERYIQKAHSSSANQYVCHVDGESTKKQRCMIFFFFSSLNKKKKKKGSSDPQDSKDNSTRITGVLM